MTVDGCLIQSQGKAKCDYIIIVCNTQKQEDSSNREFFDNVYFVELKGRDFLHAVDQLTQTINDFKSQVNGKLFARIVLSKVSKPEVIKVDAKVVRLKKILKQYGGNLEYKSKVYDTDNV
ncbi:MAG: hypothetical protein F6K21_38005 [Symploca sp. SIO2D2]|nr:hypothetical protein [Symploca sp. SIO2D2]